MGIYPWLAGELVENRRQELAGSARRSRQRVRGDSDVVSRPARQLVKRLAHHVGTLLILWGRRLAGPEGWAEALDC